MVGRSLTSLGHHLLNCQAGLIPPFAEVNEEGSIEILGLKIWKCFYLTTILLHGAQSAAELRGSSWRFPTIQTILQGPTETFPGLLLLFARRAIVFAVSLMKETAVLLVTY